MTDENYGMIFSISVCCFVVMLYAILGIIRGIKEFNEYYRMEEDRKKYEQEKKMREIKRHKW